MSHEAARRTARLFVAAALLIFLALPAVAAAQSSYQVRFAKAENTIRTHEPTISWWEQQSTITLGIGLTIVALGIATGVLQALSRPWTRPATLVVGALVTALTAVNTTFFDGDYKTLLGRAREGRSLIGQADTFIKLAPSLDSDSDREEALRYIQESAESLAQLVGGGSKGRPVVATSPSAWRVPSLFTNLLAAGVACGCESLKQQDTAAYRYFCGEGTAKSLSDARKIATENALGSAYGSLRRSASQSSGDWSSYVRSVASEVAACPTSGPKGFTMFVVLRVPSTLTSPMAQQAFVRPMARARMRLKLDKIRVIEDGSAATTGWVFEVKAGGRSFTLPNKDYTDRPNRNEFVPTAADGAMLDVEGDGAPLRVEVSGRRSFGGDTARGAQTVAAGTPTVVSVRNESASKGAFEFTFSISSVQ